MLRVVLDTNVVISGLIWRGTPHQLLAALLQDAFTVHTSYSLISELTRKLMGSKLNAELLKRDISAQQLVMSYSALCDIISVNALAAPVCRDPDDDAVLACAKTAKADYIVSGDQDLLVIQVFEGIPIVTPAQALTQFRLA